MGTGRPPIVPVKTVDVFMPESMFSTEAVKAMLGAKNLGTLLVEQATAADGTIVKERYFVVWESPTDKWTDGRTDGSTEREEGIRNVIC